MWVCGRDGPCLQGQQCCVSALVGCQGVIGVEATVHALTLTARAMQYCATYTTTPHQGAHVPRCSFPGAASTM